MNLAPMACLTNHSKTKPSSTRVGRAGHIYRFLFHVLALSLNALEFQLAQGWRKSSLYNPVQGNFHSKEQNWVGDAEQSWMRIQLRFQEVSGIIHAQGYRLCTHFFPPYNLPALFFLIKLWDLGVQTGEPTTLPFSLSNTLDPKRLHFNHCLCLLLSSWPLIPSS